MKDFMTSLQQENNKRKTLTENGATAYATSGKKIMDFNFQLGALRSRPMDFIMNKFLSVYFEDPMDSVKYLFWAGDIREGAGERNIFRSGLKWLGENKPDICKAVIPLVGEYNRYDSLLTLMDTSVRPEVSRFLLEMVQRDCERKAENKPISLAAKWLPSCNASSQETRRKAKMLISDWGWTEQQYRKVLAELRAYLDVVEVKMSAKRWSSIKYETVPSKANLTYNNSFLRNDEVRRRGYLESLKRGETKINAKVLQPHEIVSSYRKGSYWYSSIKDYDETLEQLWKNLPDMTISNTLVVRDGSGSMQSPISGKATCLDVATALTVYMAQHNSGGWKNKFVTFSAHPQVLDISKCKSLKDTLQFVYGEDDCSNTDIYKTMKLILNTAIANRMSQEEMPKMIVICSDMQFDGRRFNINKTLFEDIIDEYEAAGYKMPRICFWNINDRGQKTVPLQENDLGLILCSGFSVQIMKMFMSNKLDPYQILMEQINAPRYDAVEEAIKNLI